MFEFQFSKLSSFQMSEPEGLKAQISECHRLAINAAMNVQNMTGQALSPPEVFVERTQERWEQDIMSIQELVGIIIIQVHKVQRLYAKRHEEVADD